jgi:hypothetical protein
MANPMVDEPGDSGDTGAPILAKPYRQGDLARALERALGQQ